MDPKYAKKTTTLANGSTRCYYYKTLNGSKTRVSSEEYKKHMSRKKKGGECASPQPGEPVKRFVDCVKAEKAAWCEDYPNKSEEYRSAELEKYGRQCEISDAEVEWCKAYPQYAEQDPEYGEQYKGHYLALCSKIIDASSGGAKSKKSKSKK